MTNQCYAMVRGSAIRVTGLGRKGSIPGPTQYATSRSVAKVVINEATESGSQELLGSEERDNESRLRFSRPEETTHYSVDIDFLRCDPGILSLVAGVPLVYRKPGVGFHTAGFGLGPFGGLEEEMGFGAIEFGVASFSEDGKGEVVGFDAEPRRPAVSFALEVWSKLAAQACEGERTYGYTLFPYLRGGYLSGFEFANGLVSFNLRGAKTRRASRWGIGPYDLTGAYERLLEPVSRNTLYRQMLTSAVPPTQVEGIQEATDVIDGGTASVTTDDVLDGGTAAGAGIWAVEGGRAL